MTLPLQQASQHVYFTPPEDATDRPILAAVVGSRRVLAVDAGNSPAHAVLFQDALRQAGIAKPDYVALTHWHWDHIFGAVDYEGMLIAHQETAQMLGEMSHWKWSDAAIDARVEKGIEIEFCRDMMKAELTPPQRAKLKIRQPDITFSTRMELDLGGLACQVIHVGGDHCSDSTVIYIPQDRIVFLGDCTSEYLYETPWYYTTRRLFKLMDDLLALDADQYFHAHIPEPITRVEMERKADTCRKIGGLVERTGSDRTAVLNELQQVLGSEPSENDLELADSFLAGLEK